MPSDEDTHARIPGLWLEYLMAWVRMCLSGLALRGWPYEWELPLQYVRLLVNVSGFGISGFGTDALATPASVRCTTGSRRADINNNNSPRRNIPPPQKKTQCQCSTNMFGCNVPELVLSVCLRILASGRLMHNMIFAHIDATSLTSKYSHELELRPFGQVRVS